MRPVLTCQDIANEIGFSYGSVYRWTRTDPKWRACISHTCGNRAYFSRKKLIDAGLLLAPESQPVPNLRFAD